MLNNENENNRDRFVTALPIMLLFLILRLFYMARTSLSGDEGVFAMMSISIARGQSYPLYCWGAHYASALISYMALPVMSLLGPSAYSFRAATLPWGIGLIFLAFFSLRRQFGWMPALLTTATIAAPVPVLFVYSVAANGGYAETYFLGFAMWVLALGIVDRPSKINYSLFGFLAGASFAICWLGLPFIASSLALLLIRNKLGQRRSLLSLVGFFIGSLPFFIYNIFIAPGATFRRLGARSLEINSQTSTASTSSKILIHAVGERMFHVGEWMSQALHGLAGLFNPVGGLLGAAVLITAAGWGAANLIRSRNNWGILVVTFFPFLLALNFAGNLTRDRHWSPLWFALIVGWLGLDKKIAVGIMASVFVLGLAADTTLLRHGKPDPRIAEIARLLERTGADGLASDYDLGYPIAFEAGGRFVLSTTLPPNMTDRRPDWTEQFRKVRRPAVLLPEGAFSASFDRALVSEGIDFWQFKVQDRILYVIHATGDKVLNLLNTIVNV